MRRTAFRRAFLLTVCGALCITASHAGLAGAQKAPQNTANEPDRAQVAAESNLSDGQILGVLLAASDGEVSLASLANSKAQSEPVQQFARLVLNDQTAAKQQALAIGARTHTKPAASSVGNALEKQFDDAMGRLEKGGSLEFDRLYMESQIRLLQSLTRVLDELAPKAASNELKGLVTGMQSRVVHHLEVARGTLGNR